MSRSSCAVCGCTYDEKALFIIDDERVCRRCLFGDVAPVEIYPIGRVINGLQRDGSNFGLRGDGKVSQIQLSPLQKRFMYRLEDERFLTIVYYLHESRVVKSIFKRGLDHKKVGVFASRTPHRLSKIGIQDVKLLKIEGTTLYVEGLDAINGTPVLDIKLRWRRRDD